MQPGKETDRSPQTLTDPAKAQKKSPRLALILSIAALAIVVLVVVFLLNPFAGPSGGGTSPTQQTGASSGETAQASGVDESAALESADAAGVATGAAQENSGTASTAEASSNAVSLEAAIAGDTVHLGAFSFVAYAAGKETQQQDDFAWLVLAVQGNRILLISKDVLDTRPYNTVHNEVTWEDCSLRQWLNNDFYECLPSNVREQIVETPLTNSDNAEFGVRGGNTTTDRLFLLSIDEANTYFSSDEQRQAALEIRGNSESRRTWRWWLRSPGNSTTSAALVGRPNHMDDRGGTERDSDGSIFGEGAGVNRSNGVRPAFWLER